MNNKTNNKSLKFSNLVQIINKIVSKIPEERQIGKIAYSLEDTFLSILAMMFFQSKSMLEFQRALEKRSGRDNLKLLFGVKNTPSDRQIKTIADSIPAENFTEIFTTFFELLQDAGIVKNYEFLYGYHLVPIDGSQFFGSKKINCGHCLEKETSDGKIHFSHHILQAAIVKPGVKEVIPLFPEAIENHDGQEKQDCEINASKRYLPKIRKAYPNLKIILLTDDLYSKQPFIKVAKTENMSYISVAKPSDHKTLYDNIFELEKEGKVNEKEVVDDQGRVHRYRYVNEVKLNKTKDPISVNFFDYEIFDLELDKVTYTNSWITDVFISPENVAELTIAGRTRWKIENENFNILKNGGYKIEHNYGHGKDNLSMNFFIFNLIAFFMHQIFQVNDSPYRKAREQLSSQVEFWNRLRTLVNTFLFNQWVDLLDVIIDPDEFMLVRKKK